MDKPIVISRRVVERLRFMDPEERRLIFETLISDEVLCEQRTTQLTVTQELNYILVRDMVLRDSHRCAMRCAAVSATTSPVKTAVTMLTS